MPKTILSTVAIVLSLVAVGTARAQEPLINRVVQSNWLHCAIVGGRISVDCLRLGSRQLDSNSTSRKETLIIRNENGQFKLSYIRTTPEEQLTADISSPNCRVAVRREPRGKGAAPAMEFKQIPNEKIVLTLGSGTEQKTFRAQNIWQLFIAEPQVCREHLIPILELARPNWKLADTAAVIETKLLREAGKDGDVQGAARWATLVAQLADDSFAKREAADRALRAGGVSALAYLRQLDVEKLDAEQQFRVQRIGDALSGQTNDDSIEQIVASLAGEPTLWFALLTRPDANTRQIAARQLTALLGEPIPVDPTAAPDTQKQQREQLWAKIAGK